MKRVILIISFLFWIAGQLLAQNGLRIMESLVMRSRILNQDVKYSVCLPENYYSENKSYPVVYLLHGLGDDETVWLEYGRISQIADVATENREIVPMIFIMPEGYRTYYVNDYLGTFRFQDMFVNELVPYIDSVYRTIPDSRHRGLAGYSMGGFGALILHLQHPEIFGSAVPLSISIRTDEQYMTEYAPEWDEQWGRLFGAVGIEGPGRITEYCKQNNPFYIIPKIPSAEYNKFRIYIDNGDKERTLCRSNEELHILMHNTGFPHEFRVRNGGHSFEYWYSAMPNALRFLSDAFEGKPYRGDVANITEMPYYPDYRDKKILINGENVIYYTPAEYEQTNRFYPVLYIAGDLSETQCRQLMEKVHGFIKMNEIAPMLVVFLPGNILDQFTTLLPQIEEKLRIRKGYRFRSLLGYRDMAEKVCTVAMNQVQFSSCLLVDPYLDKEGVIRMIHDMPAEALKKTPFYLLAPDKGDYVEGIGNMHMMFRDKEIKHEYRVVERIGGFEEWLLFVAENFHR